MGRWWGVPAHPGSLPPSPAQRSRGSPCLRQGSGEARRAGTQTSSGFRATRAAGPALSRFLQDRARHGPEAPRGTHPHIPPKLLACSRLLEAGDLHSPPWVRACHSPTAKTWGSCDRGGGAAHLGQVRSGDSPSGSYRCSPAQQPGPRADPNVPLCAQGWRSRMSCVQLSYWEPRPTGLGGEAKPAQPDRKVSVAWGTPWRFHWGFHCGCVPPHPALPLPPGSLPRVPLPSPRHREGTTSVRVPLISGARGDPEGGREATTS